VQEVQATLSNGTVLRDRYVIEDLLGKGGFGAVYLVRDQRVKGNLFALKEMIDSSKQERARFAFECQVLTRLDSPALPRVYRVFEDDKNNRAYMLMDYIEGPNLETLRQKQPDRRFSLSQVMSMMAPIINAVEYLHHQQPPIIHRDIKPANIIVPNTGDTAMLVDFGIAKEFDPDSTTTAVRR
jgi:serine/threonine protein kinase